MGNESLMSSTRMTLLVGTTKGAFFISGGNDRNGWAVQGPYCDGWPINHMIGDPETAPGRAAAAIGTAQVSGAAKTAARVGRSPASQRGRWTIGPPSSQFRKDSVGPTNRYRLPTHSLKSGRSATHTARCMPAPNQRTFWPVNGGEDWKPVHALTDHPSAESWGPGAAGLLLHTIVSDPGNPKKLWVGISAAGVFATEDGGATWERRNRLSNAEASGHHDHPAAPRDGDVGHCVHNMMRAPGTSDVLYQQNHHGVWRSADGGRSWDDRTKGLPLTFGFPIRVHPRDPDTIWTMPLNGDMAGRFPPDAAAAVWRSRDGGKAGRRCAKVCRKTVVSSLCSVRRWRVTNAIQRKSISAQTAARSSRVSMKVRIGRRSRVTCQRYSLSKYSNGDNICRSTALVASFPNQTARQLMTRSGHSW